MKVKDLLDDRNLEYFYIMHLSYNGYYRKEMWDYANKFELIGLDHKNVKGNWVDIPVHIKESVSSLWFNQFELFCNMNKGDIVLIFNGWDSLLGVGETTTHKHNFNIKLTDVFFNHIRKINWIKKYEYAKRKLLIQPITFLNTLSLVTPYSKRWSSLINEDI